VSVMLTDKITPRHQERQALIYVRQSTPRQVREHRAGQANQYALVDRAVGLGWPRPLVQVIDDDLGQSGRDSARPDLQLLVAEVSLGHVGLVLAYEASRLARNNTDWYRLLDLAALVGTLIADVDGVFDPRQYHDRLLLGLHGMLSEAEWHFQRQRLDAGRQRQISQGTYRQLLPTGLVRLEDGRVVTDPDAQVRHTIEMVFTRFGTLGSCQKVLRSLRDEGVLLPRRQTGGLHTGQLLWKRPNESAVYEILTNPAYAGAFVFGRTGRPPDRPPGRRGRVVRRPPDQWTAVHHHVYPAFIDWERFMAIQSRLADNASNYERRMRGTPRDGAALLAGLVVCGHCGRQVRATYKPTPRYVCTAMPKVYGGSACLSLEGATIEAAVVGAFFEALQPAELDLLDEVLAEQRADQERLLRQHVEQVARAEYEARLAEKQYSAVDPDNRLVASELERRWERALQTLMAVREAAERATRATPEVVLDPTLREQLRDLGPRLPELWESDQLSAAQQKELLRSLIRRIILTRPVADAVEVKIVWVSGAYSELTIHPAVQRTADLADYDRLIARLAELSAAGYGDQEIAQRLGAEGFRGARSTRLSGDMVGKLRRANSVPSLRTRFRQQARFEGQWTTAGLARHLGVSRRWLDARIAAGTLPASQHPLTGHYLIADDPDLIARLRASSPGSTPAADRPETRRIRRAFS
jgi:DNA invertase Pin-like site-specific DNA recombinase